MFDNMMCNKLAPGMCKLSMSGDIAVKTSEGYKSYDVKSGRLTNCSNFVAPGCDGFFFAIPSAKVKVGDIILIGGKPKCVTAIEKNKVTVLNYENSSIETIVPERHIFMGNAFFYTKIVSMFGSGKGSKSMKKMLKWSMLSSMMGKNPTSGTNDTSMNPMMFALAMNGSMGDMFDDMFDGEDEDENEEEE